MEEYEDYSFEKAETRYKIETADQKQMELYLNANRMACTLYDLICWRRAIYNGKNYGEGSILYKGKLYTKNEWEKLEHTEDEYDEETHFLKEKTTYLYTEEELESKLDELLKDIDDFIYNYME